MCGVICVNKPEGFTSFDVIAKMRGILKIKRLGHAGTLDPMATGVLPVFVGRATKACDILPDHDKIYRAGFKLGLTTDTQDCTGTVTQERDPSAVTENNLLDTLERFRGEIMQIPPMYSAVSVNGKRLYDLARQGIEVEREARPVTIYRLELAEFDEAEKSGVLTVSCSKGTYIRTLINDIGEALGCGGIMTSLVRTTACGFSLEDCVTIEDLQREAENERNFEQYLKPVEDVFAELPKLMLHGAQERMYRNGIKLDLTKIRTDITAERISVYGEKGFIGTAVPDRENGVLRVDKTFYL
ncbi:MAG: tRNA pseudouridine(55) synthase TruB [Oscillospiraceae bacterium]|nr:tRNA pseudouridine(55) synthase TruB [Oscillospiraceae bacterium]